MLYKDCRPCTDTLWFADVQEAAEAAAKVQAIRRATLARRQLVGALPGGPPEKEPEPELEPEPEPELELKLKSMPEEQAELPVVCGATDPLPCLLCRCPPSE